MVAKSKQTVHILHIHILKLCLCMNTKAGVHSHTKPYSYTKMDCALNVYKRPRMLDVVGTILI